MWMVPLHLHVNQEYFRILMGNLVQISPVPQLPVLCKRVDIETLILLLALKVSPRISAEKILMKRKCCLSE